MVRPAVPGRARLSVTAGLAFADPAMAVTARRGAGGPHACRRGPVHGAPPRVARRCGASPCTSRRIRRRGHSPPAPRRVPRRRRARSVATAAERRQYQNGTAAWRVAWVGCCSSRVVPRPHRHADPAGCAGRPVSRPQRGGRGLADPAGRAGRPARSQGPHRRACVATAPRPSLGASAGLSAAGSSWWEGPAVRRVDVLPADTLCCERDTAMIVIANRCHMRRGIRHT